MRAFLLAGVMAFGCAGVAQASVYSFVFSSSDLNASGTITIANQVNTAGGYDITAITGSVARAYSTDSETIASLVNNPNQPNSYYDNKYTFDNVLFPFNAPVLDPYGVAFTSSQYEFNAFSVNGRYQLEETTLTGTPVLLSPGTFQITPIAQVPEPASLALLGMGVAGVAAVRRKSAAPEQRA